MSKFHPSVYNYEVPEPVVSSFGLDLYPLGNPGDDLFFYANHWNGSAFINIRYIKDALHVSKHKGISFNRYELNKFKEFRQELELTIREQPSEYVDFYLGKYKLLRFRPETKELEFHKIIATDYHQKFAGSGVILNAQETLAFFATFDTVESKFCQFEKDLQSATVPDPSVAASIEKLHQADNERPTPAVAAMKPKASAPITPASSTIKYQKQEPEYFGPGLFDIY